MDGSVGQQPTSSSATPLHPGYYNEVSRELRARRDGGYARPGRVFVSTTGDTGDFEGLGFALDDCDQ